MATKTVILRPINVTLIPNEGKGTVSALPSDTSPDNYHLLLSEAVADNEATCVLVTQGKVQMRFQDFAPTILIQKLVFYFSYAYIKDGISSSVNMDFNSYDKDGNRLFNMLTTNSAFGDGNYALFSQDCTIFVKELNGTVWELTTRMANSGTHYITQAYIELTYEEPDPIYIRENNAWTPIEGTIYHKENGVWVESNVDVFSEGDKFTLVTV